MGKIIRIKATDGTPVAFFDETFAQGGMKDAHWSEDHSCVALFFRDRKYNTPANRDRLETICGLYRKRIFEGDGGDYWKELFAWPQHVVIHNGLLGIVVPAYREKFFFESGRFKGKEKEGKWFASAKLLNKFVEDEFKGSLLTRMRMLIQIARAVKRLHAAGLAHSDLSYKNVLVDPRSGSACVIDCDGLVVPGKYPPDVMGTPDFIAPEVFKTKYLASGDPAKALPSILTDRHALAVLIYMYLLNRHPLRGGKVNDADPAKDEELSMGAKALFIEHPTDKSNRPIAKHLSPSELPQGDVARLPYSVCGPVLKPLFDRAFIDGLHNPSARPSAEEWLRALVQTTDLIVPCPNAGCTNGWIIIDPAKNIAGCPCCGEKLSGLIPVLDMLYSPKAGVYKHEDYSICLHDLMSIYRWHANRFMFPNETMPTEQRRPIADVHFVSGRWVLVNRAVEHLWDKDLNVQVPIGASVELTEGKRLLFGTAPGDRLAMARFLRV